MRWIAERLAEQAFGRAGIAQRREQEVDSGTGGIDGPIEVTPSALHSNIGFIDAPGFVGRLEMTAQPLFQFGTVTLHPTPDGRVIRLQTALGEQLFVSDPSHPQPRVINTDKARLYGSAIAAVKAEGTLRRRCRHRPVQYLNNILEQDHRAIKRLVKAKQGFREFQAAQRTIAGYEAIHMICKGQARWVSD